MMTRTNDGTHTGDNGALTTHIPLDSWHVIDGRPVDHNAGTRTIGPPCAFVFRWWDRDYGCNACLRLVEQQDGLFNATFTCGNDSGYQETALAIVGRDPDDPDAWVIDIRGNRVTRIHAAPMLPETD